MGHPDIDNRTPFAFEPVFVSDENLSPVVVTVVKATYDYSLNGEVELAEEQIPVSLSGEFNTDNDVSSYKYEPEVALSKPGTDIALVAHAWPRSSRESSCDVGVKVGSLQKIARVFGDRFWMPSSSGMKRTKPKPVTKLPLIWENAYGGSACADDEESSRVYEYRNPVGTGFAGPKLQASTPVRLPNIETPDQLISRYGEVVPPCGFGFTSPSWKPRADFAGTYDEDWALKRKPKLPRDFDSRFFQAGAPGLVSDTYLTGNEQVVLLNVSAQSRVSFRLPNVPPPVCTVEIRKRHSHELQVNLDTVIVNADEAKLVLIWRSSLKLMQGPHDVSAIAVRSR